MCLYSGASGPESHRVSSQDDKRLASLAELGAARSIYGRRMQDLSRNCTPPRRWGPAGECPRFNARVRILLELTPAGSFQPMSALVLCMYHVCKNLPRHIFRNEAASWIRGYVGILAGTGTGSISIHLSSTTFLSSLIVNVDNRCPYWELRSVLPWPSHRSSAARWDDGGYDAG